jgi:proteasome lid subunit RPN8/RPN11
MTPPEPATLPAHVALAGEVADAIFAHARATLPDECCGFLFGDERGAVRGAVPATNQAAGPRFAIAPPDVLAAHHEAARRGLGLVGFYHSHPHGPAAPSPHDQALAWPGHLYVIAAGGSLRAFVTHAPGAAFEEVPVAVGTAAR